MDRVLRPVFAGRGCAIVLHRVAATGARALDWDLTVSTAMLEQALSLDGRTWRADAVSH